MFSVASGSDYNLNTVLGFQGKESTIFSFLLTFRGFFLKFKYNVTFNLNFNFNFNENRLVISTLLKLLFEFEFAIKFEVEVAIKFEVAIAVDSSGFKVFLSKKMKF